MGTVLHIRKTVLPEEVYKLIERYMLGQLKSLHMLALDNNNEIIRVVAGESPGMFFPSGNSGSDGKCVIG